MITEQNEHLFTAHEVEAYLDAVEHAMERYDDQVTVSMYPVDRLHRLHTCPPILQASPSPSSCAGSAERRLISQTN